MSRSKEILPRGSELRSEPIPSVHNFNNLTGLVIGLLKIICYSGRQKNHSVWGCECICGNRIYILSSNLVRGNTLSCGCFHSAAISKSRLKHGMSGTPEYITHKSILARCSRSNCNNNHFERGITVCDRWKYGDGDRDGFECFYEDMGNRPEGMSIDRRDNDGNYEPDNCRWATKKQQARNTSKTKYVEFQGKLTSVRDALDITGTKPGTYYARIRRGVLPQEALL